MKKTIFTIFTFIITIIILVTLLTGCTSENNSITLNIEQSNSEIYNNVIGLETLIPLKENELYYDSTTRIIYFWNGNPLYYRYSISPSPYYAPNGLPYKYNPETNSLEEININNHFINSTTKL